MILGIDEVGRGAWFGHLSACAFLADEKDYEYLESLGVRDSKRLSAKKRELIFSQLENRFTYAIGSVDASEIDRINVHQATLLAMKTAVEWLQNQDVKIDEIRVDGRFVVPGIQGIKQTAVINGDARDLAIGAASIIAKVTRDRAIVELSEQYPGYNLDKNKGYAGKATHAHNQGIAELGLTPLHRRTFIPSYLLCNQQSAS